MRLAPRDELGSMRRLAFILVKHETLCELFYKKSQVRCVELGFHQKLRHGRNDWLGIGQRTAGSCCGISTLQCINSRLPPTPRKVYFLLLETTLHTRSCSRTWFLQ